MQPVATAIYHSLIGSYVKHHNHTSLWCSAWSSAAQARDWHCIYRYRGGVMLFTQVVGQLTIVIRVLIVLAQCILDLVIAAL